MQCSSLPSIGNLYTSFHKKEIDKKGFHGVIEWDLATGKEAKRIDTPRVHEDNTPITTNIVFSPAGAKLYVSGGQAEPITANSCYCVGYLWEFDRKTGKLDRTVIENVRTDYVRTIALSPDGRKFTAIRTPDRNVIRNKQKSVTSFTEIRCYDITTWELDWSRERDTHLWSLTVSPDGKRLGLPGSHGFDFLDATTGEPQHEILRASQR